MATGSIKCEASEKMSTLIKRVNYSYKWTTSVAANDYLEITASQLGFSTPSGYKVMGITRFTSGTNTCVVTMVNPNATGSATAIAIRNKSSSAKSNYTAIVGIMYIRTNTVN